MARPLAAIEFKVATAACELEQIHALNYRAFVEEIPQHPENAERRLVDTFHDQNTYLIGLLDGRVIAMLALRDRRPFSLDRKLPDLDSFLPAASKIGEIRLLVIATPYRGKPRVFRGLVEAATRVALQMGWDLAVISGTTRQLRLYEHLGFVPFGPVVGAAGARFQPMYCSLASAREHLPWMAALDGS